MATVLRRYTFKLYPNRAQDSALHQQRRMCAQLWNALLQMREEHWRGECQRKPKEQRKGLTAYDQGREITKLRAECPEWKGMSAKVPESIAGLLDDAFKAFFRRLKAGEGMAGYPRYKNVDRSETIPFRGMNNGWRLENGRCAAGAKAQNQTSSKARRNISCGEPENAVGAQADELEAGRPGACGEPENAWRLYVKGVPGLIRARGRLPRDPVAWKNADVMFRDGAWWISVCVELDAVRQPGAEKLHVRFDLIDEFARVERVEGATSAPRESANLTSLQEVRPTSDAAASGMGSSDRDHLALEIVDGDAAASGMGSSDRDDFLAFIRTEDAAAPALRRAKVLTERADTIKSGRDTHRKRRSWRWRQETARAALLTAKAARIRKDALHRWTTEITRASAELSVVAPAIKENTRSAKGDARSHGAAVEINADLNRNTLNQAPALAIQMLAYKAAEAAIPFALVKDEAPALAVGQDIAVTTKAARRARRILKKELAA